MSTRNIVPRASGEGGIGTAAKKWALGWINALVVTTLNALTLTAQAVGFTIAGGTTSKTLTVTGNATISATPMDVAGSNLAIGSDADGDMYYRASSLLARLAKGAANLKVFMNAGATAPEWAAGIGVPITITHDMSVTGNVATTGVGFKPKALIVIATIHAAQNCFSVGFATDTSEACVALMNRTTPVWTANANVFLYIDRGSSSGTAANAVVASIDADGFTLTWSKEGTPVETITFYVLPIR